MQKYLGSVVPYSDNFFATLNSAVFTDGSFVYIPKGLRCPMELSTYFRINEKNTGQFERTLIIADEGALMSYLEGCTAPQRDEKPTACRRGGADRAGRRRDQVLHRAELVISGDAQGKGGIYNFVTKRGACRGKNSKIMWTQVETGSAITWKYPSCILQGDNSSGRVLLRGHHLCHQLLPTPGAKMIHWAATRARRSSPRASPPATPTTPIVVWCVSAPRPTARAITPSATAVSDRVHHWRPYGTISRPKTLRPTLSMKPPRRRSARTSCSTAFSAA